MSTPSSPPEGSLRPSGRADPLVSFVWPLLFAGLSLATPAPAQHIPAPPADPVWVDQVPGPAHEYARALVAHGSELYVATNGSDGGTNTPVQLRRYGADGALVWVEALDTGTSDYPALWADDSGVCIAGATLARLDGSPPETFDDAVGFVRCVAADRTPLWTAYVEAENGPATPQVVAYALAAGQNALYVVGTTSAPLKDCAPEGCVSSGGWDAFVRKYSRDGVLQWTRQYGTPAADYAGGVWVDQSGEATVWGVEYSYPPSDFVVTLTRYAANGALRQSATLPLGTQMPYDAGFAESRFCLASQAPDPDAVWGIATDLQCYEWDKKAEPRPAWQTSVGDTWVYDVVALPSGLLVAGQAYPPLPGQQGAGFYDGFVRRYDGDRESWTIQLGTPESDEASAVAQDASRIFVAGSTGGTMGAGPDGATPGDTDAYVARLAEPFSAEAGGPYSVDEGSSVTLSALASAVDYGQTVTYAWDLDGDATAFEAPGQSVTYTSGDDGPVTVRVRATDDYSLGTAVADATIVISNVAPVVDAGPDVALELGQALSRQGVFTDPGADTWTATIEYGDSSASDVQELSDRRFALAHAYEAAGTYNVTVTVTDDDGDTGTDSLVVVVSGAHLTIADIVVAVERLVNEDVLSRGRGNSLLVKLEAAQAALDVADTRTAVQTLGAFINEVNALGNAAILDGEQTSNLVGKAQEVIASISGHTFRHRLLPRLLRDGHLAEADRRGSPEIALARQDSNHIASIQLEEPQDVFQRPADLVVDAIGSEGDELRRDVGQESHELAEPSGHGRFGRPSPFASGHRSER